MPTSASSRADSTRLLGDTPTPLRRLTTPPEPQRADPFCAALPTPRHRGRGSPSPPAPPARPGLPLRPRAGPPSTSPWQRSPPPPGKRQPRLPAAGRSPGRSCPRSAWLGSARLSAALPPSCQCEPLTRQLQRPGQHRSHAGEA